MSGPDNSSAAPIQRHSKSVARPTQSVFNSTLKQMAQILNPFLKQYLKQVTEPALNSILKLLRLENPCCRFRVYKNL